MGGSGAPQVKTVNIFLGYFFVVNFCLGTGFLGVPYSFFYSGYLAALPTLFLISLISWVNANYLLEVMARAQGLEYFMKAQGPSGFDSDEESYRINASITSHPTFKITISRKFEVVELCEIFFSRYVKYLYLLILSIYCFLASWSFSTVAGSSWALNIPYKFMGVAKCEGNPFHHSVLPEGDTCRNAYYFSLFLFALIVVTLSLIDLREQAVIQMILGLMRFLTVAAIVIYSLAKIAGEEDDVCLAGWGNSSSVNNSEDLIPLENSTIYTSYKDIVVRFDVKSWLTAIPIFTYAFILHQGLASLTHPIKQKRYLGYLTVAMFVTALSCYLILGVVAPLWFKASVQETVTLNFSEFTSSDHSLVLRMLAYYLLLFPSLDVVSAYPLMVHTVVNNVYIFITGHDTSRPSKHSVLFDFVLRITLRLVIAILPILAAFGVANLVYVLKYAGLMGFNICFFFPTALQLRSIFVCKRVFAPNHFSVSGSHGSKKSLVSTSGTAHISTDQQPLLSTKQMTKKEGRQCYMTPFSYRVLSHPLAVLLVGGLGVCLFVLTLASLGVHPEKLDC